LEETANLADVWSTANRLKPLRKEGSRVMMGGKKIKGRKRHIITDTQGLVLGCYVGSASENDRDGVKSALEKTVKKYHNIKKMWADMGYQGKELKASLDKDFGIDLEVVKRPACRFWVHKDKPTELLPIRESGFKVEPRRWVVERTFAWIGRNRRLSKEYDLLESSTENNIYMSLNRLILRRLCSII
jgi:putative transposase